MTAALARERATPLVAVVSEVPLVYAALEEALAGLASVAELEAGRDDLAGLLASLAPDAVVVACAEDAARLADVAARTCARVVEISLREGSVRVFADGSWKHPPDERGSPEGVRNLVVEAIFGRQRRR